MSAATGTHRRVAAEQARATDINGMELAPVLARFTDDQVAVARRLARHHGHRPTLIDIDPAGAGWRFLRMARAALDAKDPGASPYVMAQREGRRARAERASHHAERAKHKATGQ